MLRTAILCLLFFSQLVILKAQKDTAKQRPFVFAGIGNYEYLHVGINVPIRKKYYFEIAAGIKPWGFENYNYQMAYLGFGRKLLKEKPRKLNLFIQLKLLTWHFNNKYNEFLVEGINSELRLTYSINKRSMISLNGGVLYNSPLYYDRKTYLEVGWPHEWQPSFSLQYLIRIK